ncbi:MAG TPA: hypothetical protein DIC34_18195 [Treponema sp.]|nr:MAG: hypothetical protein A2Y36_13870 [Treponema sp. GWA1_62_8]HCM28433.1 hypothetical protein [Treponema sp.]
MRKLPLISGKPVAKTSAAAAETAGRVSKGRKGPASCRATKDRMPMRKSVFREYLCVKPHSEAGIEAGTGIGAIEYPVDGTRRHNSRTSRFAPDGPSGR